MAGGLDVTFKEPLGVVGVIVPWNFPMPIAGWGFAPALAAGNTVVLKPAELTPLTAIRLGELALEAGLPEGVFTVLPGQGLGRRASGSSTHPDVRKIVLHRLDRGRPADHGAARADQVKRVTLELGGKSANIVFADADLEQAAATAPYARLRQRRPGLLRPQPDPGRSAASTTGSWSCSSPRSRASWSATRRARRRRDGAADQRRAARDGARPTSTDDAPSTSRSAATAPDGPGFWYPPTVVLPRGRRRTAVWREEIFGPVVAVLPFDDEADAVAHGQRHASTACPARSGPATSAARCGSPAASRPGNLSVNSHSSVRYSTPFGGFKQSGLGRELGPDALDAFTDDQERLHLPRTTERSARERTWHGRTAGRAGSPSSPAACSGIGLATARRFAAEGAHGRHRRPRRRAARPRRRRGRRRSSCRCDVTDAGAGRGACSATANDTYGSVDIAFNNAGISPPDDDSILDTGLDAWRRVQEVNLTSVYLCCKAALPVHAASRAGARSSTPRRSWP